MELMQASHQWANRPADERFLSLKDLHDKTLQLRDNSRSVTVSNRQIEVQPAEQDGKTDYKAIQLVGPSGHPYFPTHHAFGQLARLVSAPAGYLRGLPSPVAADCLNVGLKFTREIEDTKLLLRKNGDATLAAVTGPNYGRVWNSDVAGAARAKFEGSSFTIPGEFGKKVPITYKNTTLYAGDRDMFIFLADEENRIEIPNRRNGEPGSLARGIFLWNSEVGDRTLGMASFLFDYVCMNRIVWGATQFEQITVRHTVSAPDRFLEEVTPAIEAYRNASAKGVRTAIEDARSKRVDNIEEFLNKRFSKRQTQSIISCFASDEGRPIESLWDAATGVTAYARGIEYQDERVGLEREAGKILDMAS